MAKYELALLVSGEATPAKKKSLKEKIDKILEGVGAKTEKEDDLGKVELTFKIKKIASSFFAVYYLELSAEKVGELTSKLKSEEGIMRYLLLRKDK